MRIRLIFAAAGLVGSVAAAQSENPYGGGSRLGGIRGSPADIPAAKMSDQDKARTVTQDLAACLIKSHRTAVLKAIQPEAWQPGARAQLVSVVDDRCLNRGELAIPPSILRGALYQQFYRESFAGGPPTLPPSPIDFGARSTGELKDDARTIIALLQFGDCVVRRDIRDSHALVLATPGSAQEKAAISGLLPHLSACVVQGSTWKLNASSLSASLSEVLYREGMASGAAKGSGG